jgi:glutamate dehydrogenase (NAD(P)+)
MTRAINDVETMSAEKKVTWRDAALVIGVDRVAEARRLSELYP